MTYQHLLSVLFMNFHILNHDNFLVDGSWSSWKLWNSCTVTCGGGSRIRNRSCDDPAPLFAGKPCSGSGQETEICNSKSCPGSIQVTYTIYLLELLHNLY